MLDDNNEKAARTRCNRRGAMPESPMLDDNYEKAARTRLDRRGVMAPGTGLIALRGRRPPR